MTSGSGSQKYSRFAYSYSLSILIFIPQLKGYLKTTFPCNTLECVLSAALTVDEYIKSSFLPHFLFSCQLSGQKRLVNSLIVVIYLTNCCYGDVNFLGSQPDGPFGKCTTVADCFPDLKLVEIHFEKALVKKQFNIDCLRIV